MAKRGDLPQSIIQAAGQTSLEVAGGLRQNPVILGLVCLNALAIGIAAWFLMDLTEKLSKNVQVREERLMALVHDCEARKGDRLK